MFDFEFKEWIARGGFADVYRPVRKEHRVQRILRHASVTTTTGTYGHLALEDLRDAVSRIGPEKSAPFADRSAPSASGAEARREFRECKRHRAE